MILEASQTLFQGLHAPSLLLVGTGICALTTMISLIQAYQFDTYRRAMLCLAGAMSLAAFTVFGLALVPIVGSTSLFESALTSASFSFVCLLFTVQQLVAPNAKLKPLLWFSSVVIIGHTLLAEITFVRNFNWLCQLTATIWAARLVIRSTEPISRLFRVLAATVGGLFTLSLVPPIAKVVLAWWHAGFVFVPEANPYSFGSSLFAIRAFIWVISPLMFYALATGIAYTLIANRLSVLVQTDELTGARSRRALFESGQTMFSQSTKPVSALLIDVDYFKKINDTHGHVAGDQALRACTNRIREVIRESDAVLSRYGGEEFCILIPNVTPATAVAMAERIRSHVAQKPVCIGSIEVAMSVSIGVSHRDSQQNLSSLLAKADKFLYQAKAMGRNRVFAGER